MSSSFSRSISTSSSSSSSWPGLWPVVPWGCAPVCYYCCWSAPSPSSSSSSSIISFTPCTPPFLYAWMIISFSSNPKLSRSFASILFSSGSVATNVFSCSNSARISYSVISISDPSPSPAPFASAPVADPGWLALLVALITAYLFSFSISLLLSYCWTISFSRSNGTFSSMSISRFFLLNLF